MITSISDTFTSENLRDIYLTNFALSKVTGVDCIQPKHFAKIQSQELHTIVTKVYFGNYKFTRYKEKLISKGANKHPRQIAIPTLRDRITLKALNNYLQNNFGQKLSVQVPQQATKDVKQALDSGLYEMAIKIDIKDFYPSVNHQMLLDKLAKLGAESDAIKLVNSAISTGFYKNQSNVIGVPQGLSISNILAEIYMMEVDKKLKNPDIFYKRYVDDVLIFCRENDAQKIYKKFVQEVKNIGLNVHDLEQKSDKTTITSISKEFSYLGYVYNPEKHESEVSVSVREASRKRFQDSIAALFTSYANAGKQRSKALLFWKLNLRITGCIASNKCKGWLFFFSEIDDMEMLFKLDNMIKHLCIRNDVDYNNVKKLTRAIHEVKHHKWNSNYFPNFDSYKIKSMKEVVSYDMGISIHNLDLSDNDIKDRFWLIINREVKLMETDISSIS